MRNSCMTARSLFDTYFNIGLTASEALIECEAQGIFTEEEMIELRETLNQNGFYRF